MPALNAARWIEEAIGSCLRQTWPNLEILIIDNGSTDRTAEIAHGFETPKVRVLQCTRLGASAARNTGLAAARGDYIQFLDADDVLDPEKIESQVNHLAQAPARAVASGAWARFAQHPGERPLMPEPVWRNCSPEEFLIESWMGGGMMPVFGWLTPRSIIEEAGPWNENLGVNDDGEYFARVLVLSTSVVFCREAKGFYRTIADKSVSKDRSHKAMRSALQAIELSCGALLNYMDSEAARHACASQYQRFAFDCYPDHRDLVGEAERNTRKLGGGSLKCPGGAGFQIVSAVLGWKAARRFQAFSRRMQSAIA